MTNKTCPNCGSDDPAVRKILPPRRERPAGYDECASSWHSTQPPVAEPATPPQAGQDAGYTPVARVKYRQSATVGVCPLSLEAYHCMEVERTLYLRDAETWKNPDWKDTPPVAESAGQDFCEMCKSTDEATFHSPCRDGIPHNWHFKNLRYKSAPQPAPEQQVKRDYEGRGRFKGESTSSALKNWSAWCQHRSNVMLADFLIDVDAELSAATQRAEAAEEEDARMMAQFRHDTALLSEYSKRAEKAEASLKEREAEVLSSDGYYLQDKRSFCGNDMVWWAKSGNGYTTDLRKAHVFTQAEFEKGADRDTDIFWPCGYINQIARPAVDHQYAKRAEALASKPEGK